MDGATPSADAADIAIPSEPGVWQMSHILVARADKIESVRKSEKVSDLMHADRDR